MIDKAENKSLDAAPRSKAQESLEEFYFSADGARPPVTIAAKSFEEAVAEYNRRFDIPKP